VIDPKKLLENAQRALLDTNVLIFALDGGKKHSDHALARALFDAMAEKKMRVLVAAPSFAEFQMRPGVKDLPIGPLIEVVPFDHDAAKVLAKSLPLDHLKTIGYAPPGTANARSCLKYDSMIVACAARHQASCIISTDEEYMPKVAAEAGVRCLTPKYFELAQRMFDLVPPDGD
jgi:predicted nucleic acid-binding protein